MKQQDIRVGLVYSARVGDHICDVRVESVNKREGNDYRRGGTSYSCTNLRTNKSITVKSATKFRRLVGMRKPDAEVEPTISVERRELVKQAGLPANGWTADILGASPEPQRKETPVPDPKKSHRPKIGAAIATKPKRIMSREELGLPMPSKGKRKDVVPEPPPPSLFPLTDKEAATFLEIRNFEAEVGHNWWVFAYDRETWVEFKRRGKPSIKNLPQHVDDGMRRKAEQYGLTLPAKQGEAIPATPQIPQPKPQTMSLAKVVQSAMVPAITPAPKSIVSKPTRGTTLRSEGVFGYPPTAICRWFGSQGWTVIEAKKLLVGKGISVSDSTIAIQVRAGAKGGDCGGRGPVPSLTQEQVRELQQLKGK